MTELYSQVEIVLGLTFAGMLRLSIGSAFLEREKVYRGGGYMIEQSPSKTQETLTNTLYKQLNNMVKAGRMGALSILTDTAKITDVQQGNRANVHVWVRSHRNRANVQVWVRTSREQG